MRKPLKGTIKNWAIIYHNPFGYSIVGEHEDGNFIRTSSIVLLTHNSVETENSLYYLEGNPSQEKHDLAQQAYNLRYGKD